MLICKYRKISDKSILGFFKCPFIDVVSTKKHSLHDRKPMFLVQLPDALVVPLQTRASYETIYKIMNTNSWKQKTACFPVG